VSGVVTIAGRELAEDRRPAMSRRERRELVRSLPRELRAGAQVLGNDAPAAAELVSAYIARADEGPEPNPNPHVRRESSQLRGVLEGRGLDPELVNELVGKNFAPIGGGATGIQGAAYMHNLPPEGTYVMDSELFARETERNDLPLEEKTYPGLGGAPVRLRISNVGIVSMLRVTFVGSLVVAGAGTVTANYGWPFNAIKRFHLNANGQTSLVTCEGLDLRARNQRIYRNPRDQITTAPALTTDGVKDPSPGVIANGTYTVVLTYDIPIVHDAYTLTGALFAQSDQIYLDWQITPAASAELFTLAGGSTATLTGTIHTTMTYFDVPYYDAQDGRKVLIPDLRWLHGYVASDQPFSNTGSVKTPFIRTSGQLISYTAYLDNGGAAVIDPTALTELTFEYGGNRVPRRYRPPHVLLYKNVQDYNGRILPAAGIYVLDFEVDNPARDLVYPKGVVELLSNHVVPAGTTINANAKVHFIEETLFSGA
jgi:hypothetical protein